MASDLLEQLRAVLTPQPTPPVRQTDPLLARKQQALKAQDDVLESQGPLLLDFLRKALETAPMGMRAGGVGTLPMRALPKAAVAPKPERPPAAEPAPLDNNLFGNQHPLERPLPDLKVHGEPVDVYHGTNKQFSEFDKGKSRDFGIHSGTPAQAQDRLDMFDAILGRGRVIPMKLGPQDRPFTSLEVSDMGGWRPVEMMQELQKRGLSFTPKQRAAIEAAEKGKDRAAGNQVIEDVLNKHNVDVLRYKNNYEGLQGKPPGEGDTSWITFNPETLYAKDTGAKLYGAGAAAAGGASSQPDLAAALRSLWEAQPASP